MGTLADLQRPPGTTAPAPRGLSLPGLTGATTVDTPEFRGMTFLEVQTKTALNKVSGMPFGWSINLYRGCQHACSYCLAPETPVLMADGTLRDIGQLQVGDQVVGTVKQGHYRRYVTSTVQDRWSTRRAAYRVTLADGTQLVTSGDHRFLSDCGWKHVVGAEQGHDRRPHLTLANRLLGPGRKRRLDGLAVEGAGVDIQSIEPLGLTIPMVDITTSTGDFVADGVISHNCFARPTHTYLNLSATGDFDSQIVVKTNLVEVLQAELARPSWKGEHVALGTNTDPYQRAEGRYQVMPGVIGALARSYTPFSILTKGTLITRDIAALQQAAQRVPVAASMTIGMLDEDVWRAAEPGTPSPRARLDAVRKLNDAGIPTGVMIAPIMPRLNDSALQLQQLTDAAVDAGATHVTPIPLHLRPGVKEAFWPWLEATYPDLVSHYAALYGAPGTKGRGSLPAAVANPLVATVRRARDAAWRRRGGPPDEGAWPDRTRPGENVTGHRVGSRPDGVDGGQQLTLL